MEFRAEILIEASSTSVAGEEKKNIRSSAEGGCWFGVRKDSIGVERSIARMGGGEGGEWWIVEEAVVAQEGELMDKLCCVCSI